MINFAVIGAQKSGTTALFEYLKKHPEIRLPTNKEASYFLQNSDWNEFSNLCYEKKPGATKTGSVTPQYMCNLSCIERMKAENPEIRIIALLRDPMSRARSHYTMNVRRNKTTNTFLSEVKRCALLKGVGDPNLRDEVDAILHWGEYGRILQAYYNAFSSNQILVIPSQELEEQPEQTFEKILRHLEVDAQWRPPNLGKKYHVGGKSTILPTVKWWSNIKFLKTIWRHCFSEKMRSKLLFWYETNNVKKPVNEQEQLSVEVTDIFVEYYSTDRGLVQSVDKLYTSWAENWLESKNQ